MKLFIKFSYEIRNFMYEIRNFIRIMKIMKKNKMMEMMEKLVIKTKIKIIFR